MVLGGWTVPSLIAIAGLGMLFTSVPALVTLYVVQNTNSNDYGPAYSAITLAFGVAQTVSPQAGGFIADHPQTHPLRTRAMPKKTDNKDPVLRIFSYLPNPRVWKATIAARIADVTVETLGAKPAELANWLWDFDAKPLSDADREELKHFARVGRRGFSSTLYKSDEFLRTQPFATVPCAFSPDGKTGIYESNSILRAVARSAPDAGLYGSDGYSASRIDSFLDADLIFAREAQVYLLALQSESLDEATYQRMRDAYEFFLNGVNNALVHSDYLASDRLSIGDIAFLCDFSQFQRELYFTPALKKLGLPIAEDLGPYVDDLKEKLQRVL